MARNIAWKVSGHDGNTVMHDTKQDIDYMYAQGWPDAGTDIFSADLYGTVGFPGKWSYSQLIEQTKKSSLLNFVTNGYRTTPNVGVYSGTSKTSGHYSFYREEVVANGTNSQITHRDPVAINTQAPQIVDYNVAANHTYRYTAYPTDMNDTVFATTAINPNATGPDPSLVQTPMINWSIAELLPVGPTTDIPSVKKEYQVNKSAVWIFKFNVSTGENSQNIGRDQVTNLAQYNKMAQGKRNYMSGTVSCYLGSELVRCTGEYTEEPRFAPLTTSNKSIAMLKAWRKFVASKNPKLLKDRKGNKYIVQLTSVSDRVDDNVPCQPSFVNFSWQEIESSEDVLITGGYENDTTASATGSTMQTIKLPTPIIHGAAFIGDTIWNTELDTPAFEDSYHFIFSIENDPLTDYYEWSLTDITSPTNNTGYEKQTVRKENIAPIIIPNSDGSGSLDNVGAFQEGHKYMLRVRGRADNSAIEDSNYYSQVIECKWLWGPNKYLDLQDQYWDQSGAVPANQQAFNQNWGFAGLGSYTSSRFVSYSTTTGCYTIGNAYNRNTISDPSIDWNSSTTIGDNVIITASGKYNFTAGDSLCLSLYGDFGYANTATRQFGLYRSRFDADGNLTAIFVINAISVSEIDTVFNCTLIQGQYVDITGQNLYPQLWSYQIGSSYNDWNNIYPWSEIKRSCGTWQNGYYKRTAYEGDTTFSVDGSAGDVFVEFPLFYYGDIKQSTSSPDWQFPIKYKTSAQDFLVYCLRFTFIGCYPYHYGVPQSNIDTPSPVLLPSSMHINYNTEQIYAVGFLSAYELSKVNGVYRSISGQVPLMTEIGTDLLNNISAQNQGLVGLKYTDHNMVCLLMAIEFGTYNINLALSGYLQTGLALGLTAKESSTCFRVTFTNATSYNTWKNRFYAGQRVSLYNSSREDINQLGAIVYDDVNYILRFYIITPTSYSYSSIRPQQWKTGSTDILSGSTNSLSGPNNLMGPCKYRGLENPFGNVSKICCDVRGQSTMSASVGQVYCYYYKNANAVTDPSGASGSRATGAYFRSNAYAVPSASSNNIIPIQNSNGVTIGSYYIAQVNTTPNGTSPGYLCQGVVGPFDSSASWYAIQVGGGAPFTSYLDPNVSCVPNGPFNIDTTQYFTNAAFGTRFSTHRTHY